jgi:putative ABC transport system ATP-binding protein
MDSATSTKTVLETKNLTRVVDGVLIVNDIDVKVLEGDFLAIVGPSGAGKSSFLRLLNRLDEPTSGTVLLDGKDYKEISPRELRRRVGMVMQSPYLFPGTVADNIRFGPSQRGENLPDEYIEGLLQEVGLKGYAGRDINHLSGGEAQRVSLARTLANSPEVLLLDEPTSALDEASRLDVEDLIRQVIHKEGLTGLIVTHDLEQAARMATRAMLLEAGRKVKIGPVEEVLSAKSTVQ